MKSGRLFYAAWCVNLLVILGTVGYLFFTWGDLPQKVPLFYSRPWGESQLASKEWLLLIPGLSLVLGLINLGLSWQTKQRQEPFLSWSIAGFSWLFGLLGAITVIKISQAIL